MRCPICESRRLKTEEELAQGICSACRTADALDALSHVEDEGSSTALRRATSHENLKGDYQPGGSYDVDTAEISDEDETPW